MNLPKIIDNNRKSFLDVFKNTSNLFDELSIATGYWDIEGMKLVLENIQNYIYITTAAGIYKSTDYGNTWTLSNSGMPAVIYDSFYGNYSNIGSKLIYGSFFYLYVASP